MSAVSWLNIFPGFASSFFPFLWAGMSRMGRKTYIHTPWAPDFPVPFQLQSKPLVALPNGRAVGTMGPSHGSTP